MTQAIEREVRERDIRRLFHFTSARNLNHILSDGEVRPTLDLTEDETAVLNPTDDERLDGYSDHVSCSIENPNVYYLRTVRQRAPAAYPTWAILRLRSEILWLPGTKFAPRNAAAGRGAGVVEGYDGFRNLFASTIVGARGQQFSRTPDMLPSFPTDIQAEVLLPTAIPLAMIDGIIVEDEAAAREIWTGADVLGTLERLAPLIIAPALFDPNRVAAASRSGARLDGTPWSPDG